MFLCDRCHDPSQHFGSAGSPDCQSESYGPCEVCGKTAILEAHVKGLKG